MGAPLKLEVFETVDIQDHPTLLMPEDIEDLRLSAFERGYSAGFEDAEAQARTRDSADRARIATAIEGLSFGYHEALSHALKALEPLLQAMITRLLPATARMTIVSLVVETLLPLAETRARQPLILRIPPGTRAAYLSAFEGLVLPPLDLVEDAGLDAAQAEIEGPDNDHAVDLSDLIARIESAVATQYFPHDQEAENG